MSKKSKKKKGNKISKKATAFHFPVHIYSKRIQVVCSPNKEDLQIINNWVLSQFGETNFEEYNVSASCYYPFNDPDTGEITIVLLFDQKYVGYDRIAHECFHATVRILESSDIPLKPVSEEAYAYLIGYLNHEVCSGLKKLL